MLQNSKNEGLKKAVASKLENREAKKEQYNANKAALAKRNAELEKKLLENEVTMRRIKTQLDNANTDKAKFKRFYEEEKRKRGNPDDPLMLPSAHSAGPGLSLKDARAMRKLAKQNANNSSQMMPNSGRGQNMFSQGGSSRDLVPPINVPDGL